jgi:SAM domain (Sterile alpha motif).
MQPTELLNSLGLGEYIPAFEDNAIDAESILSLSDADLKELGVAKLGHRKKILEAITSFSSPATSHTVDGIADMAAHLPNIVALPLREYASEEHPVAKLWAMCDTTELLLRLVVVVFVFQSA